MRYVVIGVLALALSGCVTPGPKTNLPISRQATLVESTSPAEVMIRAAGIGRNVKQAELDARRSAVYFVLFGGTDPLLKRPDEKMAFSPIAESFFESYNIFKYIAWEGTGYLSRVRIPDKKVKIEKMFRVNKEMLYNDLVDQNIIKAREELAEEVGLPYIMVVPETPIGENPVDVLDSDELARHSATVIESYLTARGYDVTVPKQQAELANIREATRGIRKIETDDCYALALSIGSDIYITYQTVIDERWIGNTQVRRASVTARAYETTTGDLLGAETGYSEERAAPAAVVAEEALHDAIDKVLSRVGRYWQKEIDRGNKFKVTFDIVGNFNPGQMERITFAIDDALKDVSTMTKKITITERTLDYVVWSKQYEESLGLYRALQGAFKARYAGTAELKKVFDTRKFLIFEIR